MIRFVFPFRWGSGAMLLPSSPVPNETMTPMEAHRLDAWTRNWRTPDNKPL